MNRVLRRTFRTMRKNIVKGATANIFKFTFNMELYSLKRVLTSDKIAGFHADSYN